MISMKKSLSFLPKKLRNGSITFILTFGYQSTIHSHLMFIPFQFLNNEVAQKRFGHFRPRVGLNLFSSYEHSTSEMDLTL